MRLFPHTAIRLERLPPLATAIVIFLIAAALRTALLFGTGRHHFFDDPEVMNIARCLARSGVFGNPYALPTGPTAHSNVLYPAMASLFFRLFGEAAAGALSLHFVAIALSSLQYALMPWAARRLGIGLEPGILAGVVGAALPVRLWIETGGTVELPAAACALMIVTVLAASFAKAPGLACGLVFGVASGLAVLVYAGFLPFCTAVLGWTVFRHRNSAALSASVAAGLCTAAVIAPWVARNYFVVGSAVLRTNYGLELALSNRDGVTYDAERNMKQPDITHPHLMRSEALRVQTVGEVEYNRQRKAEALDWIRRNPARFVRLTLERIAAFWFFPTGSPAKTAFICTLTAAAFAGLLLLVRGGTPAGALFALLWIALPLAHYLVHVSPRHRYPIDWSIYLAALFCAVRAVDSVREHPPKVRKPEAGEEPSIPLALSH